jgi:hypothetical protein
MTLNDLAVELVKEIGNNPDDTDHVSEMEGWIKQVAREVWRADWEFTIDNDKTFQTVASTATYTLDSDVAVIRSVRIRTPRRKLYNRTVEYLIKCYVNLTSEGTPIYWYNAGYDSAAGAYKISTYPVANSALDIDYTVKLLPTLESSEVLPFPEDFVDVIRHGTRARVFMDDGDPSTAQFHQRNFEKGIADLKHFYANQPDRNKVRTSADILYGAKYPSNWPSEYGV